LLLPLLTKTIISYITLGQLVGVSISIEIGL
jgi:hypothetical protein